MVHECLDYTQQLYLLLMIVKLEFARKIFKCVGVRKVVCWLSAIKCFKYCVDEYTSSAECMLLGLYILFAFYLYDVYV